MSSCSCNCTPCSCTTVSVPSLPTCDPFITCGTVCPTVPVTCPEDPQISQFWESISTFILPAVDAGINVSVKAACQWVVGCCVEIKDQTNKTEMRIGSIDEDNNILFLVNIGVSSLAAPGTNFTDDSKIFFKGICTVILPPEEEEELLAESFRMLIETLFIVPAVGASSTLVLDGVIELAVGQILFIEGGVCVEVTSVSVLDEVTTVGVDGVSLPPSILAGSSISIGSFVTTAEVCIATDDTITGSGLSSDPLSVSATSFINGPEIDISGLAVQGPAAAGKDFSNAFDRNIATFSDVITLSTFPNNYIYWDLGSIKAGTILMILDIDTSGAGSSFACLNVGYDSTRGVTGDTTQSTNSLGANMIVTETVANVERQELLHNFVGRFIGMSRCGGTDPSAAFVFRHIEIRGGDFSIT